eukprot:2122133-Prymnesium_polylepis.1
MTLAGTDPGGWGPPGGMGGATAAAGGGACQRQQQQQQQQQKARARDAQLCAGGRAASVCWP